MLLDYAETADLAVVNTFFKKKNEHLITSCSGGRATQIDYTLVPRKELKNVIDAKTAIGTASAGDVKTKWSVVEQAITEEARDIQDTTKPGRPFIDKQTWWWSEEFQVFVKKKKDAYNKWLKTRSDDSLREYREAKAEAKKAAATAKAARY
ncbi:hypothetical protein Y032_0787g2350 [Ancylostoma ceylanicum]|nr:hypothetical protein Y032_0787g2350 [Ancylostoma ceylanicum]